TLSEVWQATGLAAKRHHDLAYALFHSAKWKWDDIGKILLLLIAVRLAPTGALWLVVDDTLCHKRGAKVAFGGFFLDAVTSTRRRKNFRRVDRKSTRLNSSHVKISYAVFCLKKKKKNN